MTTYRGKDAVVVLSETTLGYVQNYSVDINRNIDVVHQLGSNLAIDIVEGNLDITGSIERGMVDIALATLVGLSSGTTLPEFNLVFNASTIVGAPRVTIAGCRMGAGHVDAPQDGNIAFNGDFTAKTYTITTVS